MKIKVIGLENVTFNFEGNKKVTGQYVHYTEAMGANGFGLKAGKMFVNDDKLASNPELVLGEEYNVYFNEYRKPDIFAPVKKI